MNNNSSSSSSSICPAFWCIMSSSYMRSEDDAEGIHTGQKQQQLANKKAIIKANEIAKENIAKRKKRIKLPSYK